jgi:hypothetical protein
MGQYGASCYERVLNRPFRTTCALEGALCQQIDSDFPCLYALLSSRLCLLLYSGRKHFPVTSKHSRPPTADASKGLLTVQLTHHCITNPEIYHNRAACLRGLATGDSYACQGLQLESNYGEATIRPAPAVLLIPCNTSTHAMLQMGCRQPACRLPAELLPNFIRGSCSAASMYRPQLPPGSIQYTQTGCLLQLDKCLSSAATHCCSALPSLEGRSCSCHV